VAVAPFQIIAGPADVYIAPARTNPVAVHDTTPEEGGWVALGRTEGGVTVRHTQSVEMLMSDQDGAPIKAIRSEEGLEIEFALAELDLETYKYALNDATITTTAKSGSSAGWKEIKLYRGDVVARHALLVRGPSPYMDAQLQYQVPIVVQTEEPEVSFTRDDKAVLNVQFSALYDLDDETAPFGKLLAQHQSA